MRPLSRTVSSPPPGDLAADLVRSLPQGERRGLRARRRPLVLRGQAQRLLQLRRPTPAPAGEPGATQPLSQHWPSAPQTAIIWESDEPGQGRSVSYAELHREVCRITNVMLDAGVRRGDVVTVYMPMVPELAMVMLACARIGAVHSVVFAGFSAESLKNRIVDCRSRCTCADQSRPVA